MAVAASAEEATARVAVLRVREDKVCVSRAPPTRAVAPGLVPRLPALEEAQEHSRGRRTGTRRREMLRAETKRR